jgi:hypothetical protein
MSIPTNYQSNKPLYYEFTNKGKPVVRDADRYLVERQSDGTWKQVDHTDRVISNEDLGKNFGLWKDRQITKGHLWWKKIVRPYDGEIQEDEVLPMAQVMRTQFDSEVPGSIYPNLAYRDFDRLQARDTSVTLSKDGGIMHTEWTTLYRHTENTLYAVTNPYLA